LFRVFNPNDHGTTRKPVFSSSAPPVPWSARWGVSPGC